MYIYIITFIHRLRADVEALQRKAAQAAKAAAAAAADQGVNAAKSAAQQALDAGVCVGVCLIIHVCSHVHGHVCLLSVDRRFTCSRLQALPELGLHSDSVRSLVQSARDADVGLSATYIHILINVSHRSKQRALKSTHASQPMC